MKQSPKKIQNLIQSARPKTLLVGASPVILGSAYAFSTNPNFSYLIFLLTLACTLLLQTATNVVNEYFDFVTGVDNDARLGPNRPLIEGKLKPEELKFFYQACLCLSFLIGIYLMYVGGLPIIIVGLLSILIAYCYTGGPLPLSHFYMGEVLAFLFFGPVAVSGTYYLQTNSLPEEVVLISAIPGFISSALMSLNNLRDITTDEKTSKKTIAIFLGKKKARLFTLLLGVSPIFISSLASISNYKILLFLPPLIFIPLWKKILIENEMTNLNSGIAMFGKYNVLYCLLISILILIR